MLTFLIIVGLVIAGALLVAAAIVVADLVLSGRRDREETKKYHAMLEARKGAARAAWEDRQRLEGTRPAEEPRQESDPEPTSLENGEQARCPSCGLAIDPQAFNQHYRFCLGRKQPEQTTPKNETRSSAKRGGFDEPYCSDRCYSNAGRKVLQWHTEGISHRCHFCGESRERARVIVPYRGKFIAVCPGCERAGKQLVNSIRECCMCGKKRGIDFEKEGTDSREDPGPYR